MIPTMRVFGNAGLGARVPLACISLLALVASCTPPPPPQPAKDSAAAPYAVLKENARADLQAWASSSGQVLDPRPKWAAELEAFAVTWPGTPESVEAIIASMDLYAESRDVAGFFRSWEMALKHAADEPMLRSSFEKLVLMRMIEAGGLAILISLDDQARERAWRAAAPRIGDDLRRVIDATTVDETRAAAHYTLGRTWYEMGLNRAKSLENFRIVAEEYPASQHASSAAMYVRELEELAVGRDAPTFAGMTLEGKPLSLASYKGKVVLIDFWASWCEPCVDQMKDLQRAWRRYHDRGFEIIGVSLDDDLDAARRFVTDNEVRWPNVASGQGMLDPVAEKYSVQTIPTSYLLDREGKIVARGLHGDEIGPGVARALAR